MWFSERRCAAFPEKFYGRGGRPDLDDLGFGIQELRTSKPCVMNQTLNLFGIQTW